MNASSEAPEDSALLEQILRESAAGGGGAGVHGGATDFGATASETVHGGAAGEGTNMAGVLSGVGARIADLKLGEKLGTLGQRLGTLAEGTGDKVLVTWNPDRVLAETVEVPVGIVGWQLRLPSGWGPYLCLPLQDGTYTRLQLAATVQALLQSTVGSKDGLEWKVMVLARQRRLCFRLISTATPPTTANRVCGFRLAPSGELCEAFGCELGPDGWLTSETDVDGSFCAGHAALGPVTVDKIPARVPAADTSAAVGQCAGLPAAAPGSSVPAAPSGGGGRRSKWRENVRASVGRHLEMATAELSDISNAARQSGASMIKLMQHPIASFGVPLQVHVACARAHTRIGAPNMIRLLRARALRAVLTSARAWRVLSSWLCGGRWRWWCRAAACDRNAHRSCSKTSCPLSTRSGGQAGQAGDCCSSSSPYPPVGSPRLSILCLQRAGARWVGSGMEVGMGVSRLVLDMGIVTGLACRKRSCGCLMIRRARPSSPGVCVGMCVRVRWCAVVCRCGCVRRVCAGVRESTCTVFVAVSGSGAYVSQQGVMVVQDLIVSSV